MKKLKQCRLTTYYRGCELQQLLCATSKKRMAELLDTSLNHINNYGYYTDEPNIQECIDNPEVIYAEIGYGEVSFFMERNKIMTYDEAKALVDAHREICKTYHETAEWAKTK